MADPTIYTTAITHLEQARLSARMAREATSPEVRRQHEEQEKQQTRLALKVIQR